KQILHTQNIFLIHHTTPFNQHIPPFNILILNLIPKKIQTQTHLLRILPNSPLQLYFTFLIPTTHTPNNTSTDHLHQFYTTFQS
ncbi:homoserine O-acetyltransferase/O-succinyltransferase family protein, partial [Bacillus pumilus]|uniref:homoserine O-acetyltransferase/O-succinyltransferase family protein n=1 Tax=Bacillus pumilus TaxID=1408 RepID=UPI001642D85D